MRSFILLPALLAATPALAQQTEKQPGSDSVTLGLGASYGPDSEGSDDYRLVAGPGAIGQVGGVGFILAGNRLSVDLVPDEPGPGWIVQAGPLVTLNLNRRFTNMIDDPRIRALGRRSATLELGGYAGIGRRGVITSDYDTLSFTLGYRKGVTGAHRGGILQPTIAYFTPLSTKAAVSVSVSGERAERKYAAAYYDVDAAGSIASGLPQYRARGGWKNYTASLIGGYSLTGDLTKGWKIAGGVTYRRLLNDFADSPVVSIAGSRDQWIGVLGLAYTF